VVAAGAPQEIVTEQLVRDVFGIESCIIPDPATGAPLVLPAPPRQPCLDVMPVAAEAVGRHA
jgi:iron complex transport system ATP-binding protein